ncbi:MAG: T9SS type A sorting domain-containing protein [Bacteroidia bacterium]|nr:T9SS type A sorting domain-containing protein [Bacteroidia bacterium]
MKNINLFMAWLTISLSATAVFGQQHSWILVGNSSKTDSEIKLVSSSATETEISFKLNAYELKKISTNNGDAIIVNAPQSARILKSGAPDLPCFATSVIIPDYDEMEIEIINSNYFEINNIDIAPSKGNLLRTVDPSSVPYTLGTEYQQNSFYPSEVSFLREPYIFRDFRGEAVVIQPFIYNPVTKVLRIYTSLSLKVKSTGVPGVNTFVRTKTLKSIDREFNNLYNSHFINYNSNSKYTPLNDMPGRILIISDPNFMAAMQPFVDWKILEGIPCEMVSLATAGGNSNTAIKNYVTNYYNTNGLTYLLLVGDAAQIPTFTSAGGGSDPSYGYIVGSDNYQEIFVGRFSAETITHVNTQVNRSVRYEKYPSLTPGKFNHCVGIGSNDPGTGHFGEYDWQHERNILNNLLTLNYTSQSELFDGDKGGLDAAGDVTPSQVTTEINNGTGIITYTGHGGDDVFVTSNFSNTDCANLTNITMWPFIWSVACVNGNFTAGTCLAEALLRATITDQPTGAVATLMSTINQSWEPPMYAQDEMVDILRESYTGNIKRTFGGLSVNGIFKMNDVSPDPTMTDTWTIFGDPSLMVRTADPMNMIVSHQPTAVVGSSSFQVDCNVEGAYIALTYNNQILGTGYATGGSATITINPSLSTVGQIINVCATAYNYVPYIGTFNVVNNNIPIDAQLSSIVQPNGTYACANISISPIVIIKNLGTDPLTSATVNYQIDGGTIISQQWTGNLSTFAGDTITFPAITITSGSHTIHSFTTNPNGSTDGYTANDELIRTYTANVASITSDFSANLTSSCQTPFAVQFTNTSTNATNYTWNFGDGNTSTDLNPLHNYTNSGQYSVSLIAHAGICGDFNQIKTNYIQIGATPPTVYDNIVCSGNNTSLSASGTGTINWYTSASGGIPVFTGTSMNVNNVTSDVTYYVENSVVSAPQYGGNLQSNINGSNYIQPIERYLIFDCFEPCTLISVEVNAATAGNRIIELRNSAGTVLQTTTVNIPVGISRITLNFNIPIGTDLRLVGPVTPNLYRNNAATNYPYLISNLISIKSTDAGSGVYYYFYNWEVKEPNCISALIPVTAHISQPQFYITTNDVSNYGNNDGSATVNIMSGNPPFTYLWSNAVTTQTTTGLSTGLYQVTVTDTIGCMATGEFNIWITNVNSLIQNSNIAVYPNPAINNLNIICDKYPISEIKVYDLLGNIVMIKKPNTKSIVMNIEEISSGIYNVELTITGQKINRKITITK